MHRIFTEILNGVIFNVYLTPGASKTGINGLRYDDTHIISIKIAVHRKPIENQANKELIKFISEIFKLPKSNIEIVLGGKSRHKKICLKSFNIDDIPSKFKELLIQEIDKLPATLFQS